MLLQTGRHIPPDGRDEMKKYIRGLYSGIDMLTDGNDLFEKHTVLAIYS